MSQPLQIAVLNLGGAHWLGGQYYFENILRVLSRAKGRGSDFQVTYVLPRLDSASSKGEIERFANVIQAPDVATPSSNLIARSRRVLDRSLGGIVNPAVHRFLVERGIDFAFPTATRGERKGGYRTAHWIADLQYKHFPEFQRPDILKGQDRYLTGIINDASKIVVSSEFGAADCVKFFTTPREKLFVMPFRVTFAEGLLDGNIEATRTKYHLPDRFLLVSNQFWQNKNHMVVFEAIGLLKSRGAGVNVVFTGHVYDPRQPNYCDHVHSRVHELGIHNEVFLLGAIPRADQINLMRLSVAVIQPSRFEGWNTTIEEARAIGRPVIASDFAVHKEQAWGGMTLFPTDDPETLAKVLADVSTHGAPGGDPVAEAMAMADYEGLVEIFGRRFLELARG